MSRLIIGTTFHIRNWLKVTKFMYLVNYCIRLIKSKTFQRISELKANSSCPK